MRRLHKGFTLIEIMVVIVIVAVLISAVALSFPPVGDKLLKENAQRFTALVSLAQDEAILQSTELSVEITQEGYRFFQNVDNSWVEFSQTPFKERKLPVEITTEVFLEGISINLKDRDNNKPQIVILSSGEMTPFTYTLQFKNRSKVEMKVDASGEFDTTFSE